MTQCCVRGACLFFCLFATSVLLAVQVVLTVSKPGEKGEVPVGVIVGSVIAGLLLLALAVGLLWKVGVLLGHGGNDFSMQGINRKLIRHI